MTKLQNKQMKFIFTVMLVILLAFSFSACKKGTQTKHFSDVSDCAASDSEGILAGMFNIDAFEEDAFINSRGINTYIARNTSLENADDVAGFVSQIKEAERVNHLFIGLDPLLLVQDSTYQKKLSTAFSKVKNVDIDVFYPVYQAEYYECANIEEMKSAYGSVTEFLLSQQNCTVYYAGSQIWFLGNTMWFESDSYGIMNSDATNRMVKSCFCDGLYGLKSVEDLDAAFIDLNENLEVLSETAHADDWEDYSVNIIFLGDSIFGNYSAPDSIPSVVHMLTKANVANCGIGGSTLVSDVDGRGCKDIMSVLRGKQTLENTNLDAHMVDANRDSFADGSTFLKDRNTELIIFFEFGINDYVKGIALNEFRNELLSDIDELRSYREDARIILVVPGYLQIPELNDGEIPFVENGGSMDEYREIIRDCGKTSGLEVFDMTESRFITEANAAEYLENDGIHYGISGRFITGLEMAEYINQ